MVCWNSPGASYTTVKLALTGDCPVALTVSVAGPSGKPGGSCTLIWAGDTKYSGSKSPPEVTVTPPSVWAMGLPDPTAVAAVRLAPNIVTIDPGATPVTGVLPAALLTPVGAI